MEKKELIFISYSSDDLDKVEIVEEILSKNLFYEPLIVERTEKPNESLVNKVKDGLKSARIIVPILTERSIYTQWLNQEIGYSFCLDNKEIIPIIDINLIDSNALKGFIHKQNDLPFKFKGSLKRGQENKSFKDAFKRILMYLEEKRLKEEKLPIKVILKNDELDTIDEILRLKEFQVWKDEFLVSADGIRASSDEVQKMMDEFKSYQEELNKRGITSNIEYNPNSLGLIFKALGYSFLLVFKVDIRRPRYGNILITKRWNGVVSFSSQIRPPVEGTFEYVFDVLDNKSFAWKNIRNNTHLSSKDIVRINIKWINDKIKVKLKGG